MYRLSFLILFLVMCFEIKAQVLIEGLDMSKEDLSYCEVVGMEFNIYTKRIMVTGQKKGNKVVETNYALLDKETMVYIDIGKAIEWGQPQEITALDGSSLNFSSTVGALNFLCNNGWEYVSSYTNTFDNVNIMRHLVKRQEE